MLGLRRVCTTLAVAFALYPAHQQTVGASRGAEEIALAKTAVSAQVGAGKKSPPAHSQAVVAMPNHSTALLETKFIDPVSLTVMSGIAAAGSLYSIGRTIKDARARSRENKQITNAIQQYEQQAAHGCAMLDTAAGFLVQKMTDLDILYSNMAVLGKACSQRDTPAVQSYQTFMFDRLSDICVRSPRVFVAKCQAVYTKDFTANMQEACDMKDKWGTEQQMRASRDELLKHIWQMDGLKRGTCGVGLNGVESLSLLQESQVRGETGVPILDVLGLAFTLIGFADMLVSVGDRAISKVWGDGVQGLLAFTEAKAREAQAAVCDTFTAIWLKSFVPGNAAKLANMGSLMIRMHVPQRTVTERLGFLAALPSNDNPYGWEMDEQSMWLCNHKKMCVQEMPDEWSEKVDGKGLPDVGGLRHPQSSCMAPADPPAEVTYVRVCNAQGEYINIVPQECFRQFSVLSGNPSKVSPIGSRKNHKIRGSGRALEFYPDDFYMPGFSNAVEYDDRRLNRKLCVKPLLNLWNIELVISGDKLSVACPSG